MTNFTGFTVDLDPACIYALKHYVYYFTMGDGRGGEGRSQVSHLAPD
jgi:hypothetical protein